MANNLSMNGRLEQQDGQNEFVSDYNNMSKVQESNGASTGISVIDYKKGYVLRKCCYEANGKRSKYMSTRFSMFIFFNFLLILLTFIKK